MKLYILTDGRECYRVKEMTCHEQAHIQERTKEEYHGCRWWELGPGQCKPFSEEVCSCLTHGKNSVS